MAVGFATVVEEDGVVVRSADVNGFTVGELSFPPGYVQDEYEPELPYLAVVVHGAMEKSFGTGMSFGTGSALTMPVGARHGARIVIVKPRDGSSDLARALRDFVSLRGGGLRWLARRLAAELRASDSAAPLAAEGLALELLAAAARETTSRPRYAAPPWLDEAEEILRTRIGDCVRLSELSAEIGVAPVQVARAFRSRHGV